MIKKIELRNWKIWQRFAIKSWPREKKIDALQWFLRTAVSVAAIYFGYSYFQTEIDAWAARSSSGIRLTEQVTLILVIEISMTALLLKLSILNRHKKARGNNEFFVFAWVVPLIVFVMDLFYQQLGISWWNAEASPMILFVLAGIFGIVRSRYGIASAISAAGAFGLYKVLKGGDLTMFFSMLLWLLFATAGGLTFRWIFLVRWSKRYRPQN